MKFRKPHLPVRAVESRPLRPVFLQLRDVRCGVVGRGLLWPSEQALAPRSTCGSVPVSSPCGSSKEALIPCWGSSLSSSWVTCADRRRNQGGDHENVLLMDLPLPRHNLFHTTSGIPRYTKETKYLFRRSPPRLRFSRTSTTGRYTVIPTGTEVTFASELPLSAVPGLCCAGHHFW